MSSAPDYSPLHVAAGLGTLDVIEYLLDQGADVDARAADEYTPLMCAAMAGQDAAVQLLAARGANVGAEMHDASTALHVAARKGHMSTVRVLAQLGAEINAVTTTGHSSIYGAVCAHDTEMVRALLDLGAVMVGPFSLICIAAAVGDAAMIRLLVERGANVNDDSEGDVPLELAAKYGKMDVIPELVRLGADVNHRSVGGGSSILHEMARIGADEAIRLLCSLGADVHAVSGRCSPLHVAAKHGCVGAIRALVAAGADVNCITGPDGLAPLHYACSAEVVHALCDLGAAVDLRAGRVQETPVLSCFRGSIKLRPLRALLQRGASPDDPLGDFPLEFAAVKGNNEAVLLLHEYGADIKWRHADGWNALFAAVQGNSPATVRLLVDLGSDLACTTGDGHTALHVAAAEGLLASAQCVSDLFLERGVSMYATNVASQTALDLATDPNVRLILLRGMSYERRRPYLLFLSGCRLLDSAAAAPNGRAAAAPPAPGPSRRVLGMRDMQRYIASFL